MKKKIIIFCVCLFAVGNIAYSGASNKSLMNDDSKSDVYYEDTGWIDMGKTEDQTWYEYYVSCAQSGLHPGTTKEKMGQYCIAHPELLNADYTEIRATTDAAGVTEPMAGTSASSQNQTSSASTYSDTMQSDKVDTSFNSSTTSNNNNLSTTNYDEVKQYVTLSKKAVYDNYDSSKAEVGSLSKGTEVSVIGETSNGYYVFEYTLEDGTVIDAYLLFKGKTNIVSKEEYDAAWAESNRVDPTCENTGYIEYTNSLSELTYKDEIEATGHVTSANSTYEVVKPGVFKNGKTIIYCDKCGKIAREENIDSYFKTQTLLIILIGAFGIVFIISVLYLIKKKRMEAIE